MRVLVTGGAGFIGSALVDKLVKNDHQVLVIDNFSTGSEKNLKDILGFCDEPVVSQTQ